jgi:hypothetical protein
MAATAVTPNPVRAEELVLPLATFEQGDFTIFLPSALAPFAVLGGILSPKVHVFFAAAGVQRDLANDVLVHGLRSASNNSDWILIAVRGISGSSRAISDAEIRSCLSSVGVNAAPAVLRLSAHSRGCDSLVASLQPGKITTLSIIDRVAFLDEAVEHAGPGSPTPGVITLNRVAILKQRGIPATRMVSYEVGNRSVDLSTGASARVSGATYFELPPEGMAAIGCVRLIGDGIVRNPTLGLAIAANQPLQNQIAAMLMPARGTFSVMVPSGQDLKQYCRDHTAAISQIVANLANPRSSLLSFVNVNDLARFGGFQFTWGVAGHHFFVAEIAHELTK